jgi:hypothetical protein
MIQSRLCLLVLQSSLTICMHFSTTLSLSLLFSSHTRHFAIRPTCSSHVSRGLAFQDTCVPRSSKCTLFEHCSQFHPHSFRTHDARDW